MAHVSGQFLLHDLHQWLQPAAFAAAGVRESHDVLPRVRRRAATFDKAAPFEPPHEVGDGRSIQIRLVAQFALICLARPIEDGQDTVLCAGDIGRGDARLCGQEELLSASDQAPDVAMRLRNIFKGRAREHDLILPSWAHREKRAGEEPRHR